MKLIPTGIFLTDEEIFKVTQTLGKAVTTHDPQLVAKHNELLQEIAKKYGYQWDNCEIQPLTKEVLKRCENCDEEIPKEDISIEE